MTSAKNRLMLRTNGCERDSGSRSVTAPRSWRRGEDERRVGSAEAEGVRKREADFALLGLVRNEVDVAALGGVVEIDRGRRRLVAHREDREDGLDGAGGPEQVPDRGLGGRHAELVRVRPK